MDRTKVEITEGIGSVKAAISLCGQKFKKDLSSESGELHVAQLDKGRLKETKKSADKEIARAEFELHHAKNAAKELSLEIEQANAKAIAQTLELRSMRKLDTNDRKYSELMRELSNLKKELSRLKLDVATALESKSKAEKENEISNSKIKSYMSSVEVINREIEEANEEHVLVELARIEAERESREIEARRNDEVVRFSQEIEAAKKMIEVFQKEAGQAKDLEMKLAVTNSDLNVLRSEMGFVRAMERNFQRTRVAEESERRSLLETAEAELTAAKKELASIKEEGFQFMASMDVIRKELMLIVKETERLKKQERKADSTIRLLNSKLLKAKSKLESSSAAEERAKAIVSNLSAALQQLQMETEAVKKEKEVITEETKRTNSKIEFTETRIGSAEERLQAAMQELEVVKASEAVALKKLRDVTQRTMNNRALSSQQSSTITISRYENEYLANSAEPAQVIAEKKVAAAQAWIVALKAEEKEILMETELVEKEIKELRNAEENFFCKIEKVLADQNTLENGMRNAEEAELLDLQLVVKSPRKSMKENRKSMTSARKAKMRRSSVSTGVRHNTRSPSFTIKKRKKVMPNLLKFLRSRNNGKQE